MRRWLARLSFSFFVIAFLLAYQAYKLMATEQDTAFRARGMLLATGAAVAFVIGLIGVRERHRPG